MVDFPRYGRAAAYRGGNKTYGSGRNSPHQGTNLDPTGYVDRENNRQASDRRAGLAKAAIDRTRGTGPRRDPGGTRGPTKHQNNTGNGNWPTYPTWQTQGGGGKKGGGNGGGGKGDGNNGGGNPNEPPTNEGPGPVDPFAPPKVDLAGKLIPMPWEMQMDWINATRDLAEQNAGWDFQVGQSQLEYGNAMRDLGIQRPIDQEQLASGEAGRGMSFSSGNARGITDLANRYATQESDLGSWIQGVQGQYGVGGVQRNLAQANYDSYMTTLQAEAARRLSDRAGTLGLGQDNSTPTGDDKDKGGKGGKGDKGGGKNNGGGGKSDNKGSGWQHRHDWNPPGNKGGDDKKGPKPRDPGGNKGPRSRRRRRRNS